AEGELEELYVRVRDPSSGALDNIMRVHSLHPAGLASHYELYRAVMSPTRSLRRAEREMIALVVSQINECHY
ncbi:MAG: carboxymuconolactone decarboxylase family protein, partial [Acidobacteria bacterium]|nr:carboxymuconolactone decarboxylase family protein [Acidobacteriota bacterium]